MVGMILTGKSLTGLAKPAKVLVLGDLCEGRHLIPFGGLVGCRGSKVSFLATVHRAGTGSSFGPSRAEKVPVPLWVARDSAIYSAAVPQES